MLTDMLCVQGSGRDSHGNSAVEQLHSVDLEVLLDLLRIPGLVEKTRGIIERALSRGLLNEVTVSTQASVGDISGSAFFNFNSWIP